MIQPQLHLIHQAIIALINMSAKIYSNWLGNALEYLL